MTKKQRNRKLIAQNKRNKMINRRYSSTVKTLFKLLLVKMNTFEKTETTEKNNLKGQIINLSNTLFSVIDKATKKNVIHKNTAARKKSKISKLSFAVNS
jgi:small subunit ribosomal protein S20